MASTHDDVFGKYKLYSGVAIGGVLLAVMLDSCSSGPDDEIVAEARNQAAPVVAAAPAKENTIEQNLAPVEKLAVVDKNAPPQAARSGEAVYQVACLACHAAGVLEAPKLEAGAWDERIGQGLDGLVHSAINGKGAMPPRGGNPDITDEEITNAVNYMLETAGYDPAALDGATSAGAAKVTNTESAEKKDNTAVGVAPTTAAQDAEPAKTKSSDSSDTNESPARQAAVSASSQKYISEGVLGKQVYQNSCFTCHDIGIAKAPVIGDSAAWQERIGAGIDTLYGSALNGKGAMPPKGGNASLSKEQVTAAVDYMLEVAGVSGTGVVAAPEQAVTTEEVTEKTGTTQKASTGNTTQEAPAETGTTQETAEAEVTQEAKPAETAIKAGIDGEKVYRGICFSCHDMGIAGAPKLGDKAAWAPRIAAGAESMHNNSINGIGVMPPKGGNPALTDDEVRAAVDWMAQQSQ